jgi:hypothetical protein
MPNFTGEDDCKAFEEFLRHKGIDPATAEPDVLVQFRRAFDHLAAKRLATPPMGEIFNAKLKPGEFRYAVAIRDGANLWLTMTVRRDPKGDVYVLNPRQEGNPHASYHPKNGRFHHKSDDNIMMSEQRQRLTEFKGCLHMGMFQGHFKDVGAVCNPANFSDVLEVPSGILGPHDGFVAVDLIEPGCEPKEELGQPVLLTRTYEDSIPWIVVRVGTPSRPE